MYFYNIGITNITNTTNINNTTNTTNTMSRHVTGSNTNRR